MYYYYYCYYYCYYYDADDDDDDDDDEVIYCETKFKTLIQVLYIFTSAFLVIFQIHWGRLKTNKPATKSTLYVSSCLGIRTK